MAARIFQIAYDRSLLRVRELTLVHDGFAVTSAFGNAEARRLLADDAPFDVFLIGWSTTHDERKSIVSWLKRHWPAVPVVAIHDSFEHPIPGADVTATHDTVEEWLAAIEAATREVGGASASE
jgi:DNA-binding NtrC family response regulator